MVLEIFYEINDVTGVLTPYFDSYSLILTKI